MDELNELNTAINEYWEKWQTLVAARTNQAFFRDLKPTSVGWKTEDLAEFDRRTAVLRDLSDQIHTGWINERWVTTFHLRGPALAHNITLVKLMQRRPGSTDAVGLDHMDFYLAPAISSTKQMVAAEPDLKWSEENNGDFCKWVSVWFDGTEAKLRSDTVVDVCIHEMQDINKAVLGVATAEPTDANVPAESGADPTAPAADEASEANPE